MCVRVYVCVCTINCGIECDCVRESVGGESIFNKQSVGSVIPTGGTDVLCGSSTDVLGVGWVGLVVGVVGVGTVVLLSKPCCPRGYGDVI